MSEVTQIFRDQWKEFTKEDFFNELTIDECISGSGIHQAQYCFDYINNLNCVGFILEEPYIDRFYLDDYLHFYGSCHRTYPKTCKRLHFFSNVGLEENNPNILTELKNAYLGFIVVKPLPRVVIGRTVLIPYPNTNTIPEKGYTPNFSRHFLTLKEYSANLYGLPFKIKSLAFQQQDAVISACATTALWTVLEKTTAEYGYYTPTPYEITAKAHENYSNTRVIPSTGLTLEQIIQVIRFYGIEGEIYDYEHDPQVRLVKDNFLAPCYAYLRGGFPLFLGIDIEGKGYHAVAVVGYHLKERTEPDQEDVPFTGHRMDKFYIHDDNLGPFSRFFIHTEEANKGTKIFLTRDRSDDYSDEYYLNEDKPRKMTPVSLTIPVYRKIRYPFSDLKVALNELYQLLTRLDIFKENVNPLFEWDTYLTSVNQLKTAILYNEIIFPEKYRNLILKGDYPRFIWRSTFRVNGSPFLDVYADATEARNGNPFFAFFPTDSEFAQLIKESFSLSTSKNILDEYFHFPGLRVFLNRAINSL
ncbi:MAG: hypothetical protein ACTSU5_10930 [Promethearchaeota archaeon]